MKSYDIAMQMLGLHEVKDKQKLIDFFKKNSTNSDLVIDPEKVAWCSAFVNACERAVGNKGTGKLNARSFVNYMKDVPDLNSAMKGDIVVFSRGGQAWMGHVAFFDGVEKDDRGYTLVRTIGGNQSDRVSMGWYNADRLVDIRRSY